MSTHQRFRALLETAGSGPRFVIVRLPFVPEKVWKNRPGKRVKGTINGLAFRTSLFGSAAKGYGLVVNKSLQKCAHAYPGKMAEFVLEPDLEQPTATVPPELAKLMKQDRALARWFETLSSHMRKYFCDSVRQPKSPEARRRRAEKFAECMMLAMEGEETLPPILQVAFREAPLARKGWEAMTKLQRRNHLLGIFYYQSPEARERRAQSVVADALKRAGVDEGVDGPKESA
jgi:uncharacterized protein YdeI (YjbR/CyaY-like superfamily)